MTQANSDRGLFSQLLPLLGQRAVLITVSQIDDGDRLQVNICPRQLKEGENHALTTPLSVTGSAAELDTDLVSQVSTFVASHVGLHSTLTAIEKELAEAEKNAREEAKKKQKTVGNGGKKTPDLPAKAQETEAKSEAIAAQTMSLFDETPPTEAPESPKEHEDDGTDRH